MQNTLQINILILDDDPFMLKLLTKMLSKLGYHSVSTCNNGSQALARIENLATTPDIILLDLNMPEMDGIEFVRYLVERKFNGSLILVSGEDERILKTAEKLVQAHQISLLGYIHKPVDPDKLSELIQHWKSPTKELEKQKQQKIYQAEDLEEAISNHNLVNYYQPKVSVKTGAIVGMETLVRWHHPTDGVIYPNQFIPLAEQSGKIHALTSLVLADALTQARTWQQSGLNLRIAINVSMNNLSSLDFQDLVIHLVTQAGLQPKDVVLEVTESQLMNQDTRIPLEILSRLRLKRFHLSIDDFGTGHSSLAQLRDIPFDELKIDQGFVHKAWTDDTLRAIYDASLAMAKQLNMEVVAEGVEDKQDWELLRKTGCDLAQGNFISKPLQSRDFSKWAEEWKNRFTQLQLTDYPD